MKIMLLSFLMLCLIGCGSKNVVLQNVKVEKVKIPSELLELEPFNKPVVNNEIDILNAYSVLFHHYKHCEININKIKALSQD